MGHVFVNKIFLFLSKLNARNVLIIILHKHSVCHICMPVALWKRIGMGECIRYVDPKCISEFEKDFYNSLIVH